MSSLKRRGVKGLVRDEGVGVETAKGSWPAEADEDVDKAIIEPERDPLKELALEEGRSSSDGSIKPNSPCSQSICTSMVDN